MMANSAGVGRRGGARRRFHFEPLDFDKYAGSFRDPGWCIDRRHVNLLFGLLTAHPFRHALEIGCYDGGSTSAFVEALERGAGMRLTLCDVHFRERIRRMVAASPRRSAIDLREEASCRVIGPQYDVVLVDRDHRLPTVAEELYGLPRFNTETVLMHDVAATRAGYTGCEGADLLRRAFQGRRGYHYIEDCRRREGEGTHRGFAVATRNARVRELAQHLFAHYSALSAGA